MARCNVAEKDDLMGEGGASNLVALLVLIALLFIPLYILVPEIVLPEKKPYEHIQRNLPAGGFWHTSLQSAQI